MNNIELCDRNFLATTELCFGSARNINILNTQSMYELARLQIEGAHGVNIGWHCKPQITSVMGN